MAESGEWRQDDKGLWWKGDADGPYDHRWKRIPFTVDIGVDVNRGRWGVVGWLVAQIPEGPLSAVSKLSFETIGLGWSMFQDLQDRYAFAPRQSSKSAAFHSIS